MDINELTVGQIKEIVAMSKGMGVCGKSAGPHPFQGQVVLVRARNAGVHVGILESSSREHGLVLIHSCRLWRWKGANTCSELAKHGVNGEKSYTRVAEMVDKLVIPQEDVGEVIPCSTEAAADLRTPRWP